MSTQQQNFSRTRTLVTALVTIFILGLLLWQHFHGSVPKHHILDQKDLPAISNWWGAVLLPVLTWVLLTRIGTRLKKQPSAPQPNTNNEIIGRFLLGLAFGLILAVSFVNNYKLFLDNVLYILLVLSLFVPIFYAEFILGFVLGMTYTFGAILPTAFITIMSALGFIIYRFIRPLLMRLIKTK